MPIKKISGFTVIELMVVIAIIGVLSTLAAAALSYAKNYTKTTKSNHDLAQIEKAINMLSNDSGAWPGHQNVNAVGSGNNNEICGDGCAYGLSANQSGLIGTDGNYINWGGPYFEIIPDDPWGHSYFFDTDYRVRVDGSPCAGGGSCIDAAVIGSYGADGIGNNQYNADDIIKILKK
jgi:prepilin-type N-terminal cleavage/methylation domain-containing protein